MEAIVLLLFLAFFLYLGSRLWSRRDGVQAEMAGNPERPAGSNMSTRNESTSFGAPNTGSWHESQTRGATDSDKPAA